ncbi:MAG: nucleotide exchange factor GrpE [Blastocatellales bacterium]
MNETTKTNDALEIAPPIESRNDEDAVETAELIPLDQSGNDDQSATVETAPGSFLSDAVWELNRETRELRETVAAMQTRMAGFEAAMDAMAKQVSFLPPQVRMLGGKIDGLGTAISEPRYRAALLGLLGVFDLTDQILRTLPTEGASEVGVAAPNHRRNYEVLLAQLRQILESNGLTEIPTSGGFDPELHRALKLIPVADPAQSDQILEVARRGFRTEQSILRYAEVLVGQYSAPEIVADSSTNAISECHQ